MEEFPTTVVDTIAEEETMASTAENFSHFLKYLLLHPLLMQNLPSPSIPIVLHTIV